MQIHIQMQQYTGVDPKHWISQHCTALRYKYIYKYRYKYICSTGVDPKHWISRYCTARLHWTSLHGCINALCPPCLHFSGVGWVGTEFLGFTSQLHDFKCYQKSKVSWKKLCPMQKEVWQIRTDMLGLRGKDRSRENMHFQHKHLLAS